MKSNSAEGYKLAFTIWRNIAKQWHLSINIKNIIFNESGKIFGDYNFVHKNSQMEIIQSFCNLGIDISASGSFSQA